MFNVGAVHIFFAAQLEEIEIFGLVTQGQAATGCGGSVGVCERRCPPPHQCKGGGEVLLFWCYAQHAKRLFRLEAQRFDQIFYLEKGTNIPLVVVPSDLNTDGRQVNFAVAVDVQYRTELTKPFKTVPRNLEIAESHETSREKRRETLFPFPVRAR
jgi:hypothetical protein